MILTLFSLGSWSLRHVVKLLDFDSALLAVRAVLGGLMAVYMNEHAPAMDKTPDDFFSTEVSEERWQQLIKEILESPFFFEYHVYKVI